ncbi:MAG: hypothetical protein ACUVX1_16560 [Chloroflexota bacterium]
MGDQRQIEARARRNWTARLVLLAIALGLIVVFIAENFVLVDIRLIFVKVETRLAWGLLLAAFLGFVSGLVVPRIRR